MQKPTSSTIFCMTMLLSGQAAVPLPDINLYGQTRLSVRAFPMKHTRSLGWPRKEKLASMGYKLLQRSPQSWTYRHRLKKIPAAYAFRCPCHLWAIHPHSSSKTVRVRPSIWFHNHIRKWRILRKHRLRRLRHRCKSWVRRTGFCKTIWAPSKTASTLILSKGESSPT